MESTTAGPSTSVLAAILLVFADAAIEIVPFFLLALVLAVVLEEFLPERTITRFLTGRHPATMLLASTTGALIPLCTCGMVPLAVSLRRRGSDMKHTFAFLTAGAAVSVPVLGLTWKVLGVEWMLVRLAASVVFGLAAGYGAERLLSSVAERSTLPAPAGPAPPALDGAAAPALAVAATPAPPRRPRAVSILRRLWGQLKEYFPWVIVSLVLAAVVDVLVPRHVVHVLYGQKAAVGSLLASLTGLPFYFCSGAELPLVAELLDKGMGRGPALSMLLAVPIVNLLTFGVVARWIGPRGAFAYLALCVAGATAIGVVAGWVWR